MFGDLDREEAEIELGLEQPQQPALQFLVAHASCVRFKRGSYGRVVRIAHTPHQVCKGLAHKGSRVRQRRNVFADGRGLGFVLLELYPLGLAG